MSSNIVFNCNLEDNHIPDIQLTTISEAGVSIWSVTEAAEKEFPNMEAGLRSAISLARRLRDPMSELSRVPPQHLSVGQYQHDLPSGKVNVAMNDTIEVNSYNE